MQEAYMSNYQESPLVAPSNEGTTPRESLQSLSRGRLITTGHSSYLPFHLSRKSHHQHPDTSHSSLSDSSELRINSSPSSLSFSEDAMKAPLLSHQRVSRSPTKKCISNTLKGKLGALQQMFQPKNSAEQQPLIVVYDEARLEDRRLEDVRLEEDVCEDFVTDFNKHILNTRNREKAQRLLLKMRQLGGLELDYDGIVDIPAARMGLCILSGLNDAHFKMQSLNSLLEILRKDPLTPESSDKLVVLSIKLMSTMNRNLIQNETVSMQIKIAEAYNALMELMQRHYAKQHINGMTRELKRQLAETGSALANLNSQEDPLLSFLVKSAQEGIKRLKDDKQELFDAINGIGNVIASGVSFYMEDPLAGFHYLTQAMKKIDLQSTNAWYDGAFALSELSKWALSTKDINGVYAIQHFLRDNYRTLNWKFTFSAIRILFDLTKFGLTPEIRHAAFQGVKQFECPGLGSFADCSFLKKYRSFQPMVHFRSPKIKDPNVLIRKTCASYLIELAKSSPDKSTQERAQRLLAMRYKQEKNEQVLKILRRSTG